MHGNFEGKVAIVTGGSQGVGLGIARAFLDAGGHIGLQHDPLLPSELLPGRWPGDALRAEYDRYDAAYRAVLRAYLRA